MYLYSIVLHNFNLRPERYHSQDYMCGFGKFEKQSFRTTSGDKTTIPGTHPGTHPRSDPQPGLAAQDPESKKQTRHQAIRPKHNPGDPPGDSPRERPTTRAAAQDPGSVLRPRNGPTRACGPRPGERPKIQVQRFQAMCSIAAVASPASASGEPYGSAEPRGETNLHVFGTWMSPNIINL